MSDVEIQTGAPAPKAAARQPIRDAATLILVDRSRKKLKVLMGKRHEGVRFMPGKFVFPGGRVEAADGRVNVAGAYAPHVERRLLEKVRRPSATRARAFGLAAIRELAEETGLLVGEKDLAPFEAPGDSWKAFSENGVFPSLENLWFVVRAITPPQRPRRFDTRFFVADVSAVAATVDGIVGPDSELVELVWTSLDDARKLDLPAITRIVIGIIAERLEAGVERDLPVPFYRGGSQGGAEMI